MEMIPLNGTIVVKRDDPVTKTEAGIFIPPTAQMKASKGTVVAVHNGELLAAGPGLVTKPSELRIGDTVLFRQDAGIEIVLDGRDLLLINEFEILVKVKS